MPTVTEICNGGLQALGENLITDLEDDSEEAVQCLAAWARVRRAVLRSHPWNSTTARIKLSNLTEAPAYEWDYQYQLPADCLVVWDVEGSQIDTDWKVEGNRLLVDYGPPLGILYGKDEEDANIYDSLLVEVLALSLAVEICEGLTQSNTKKKDLQDRLKAAMMRAHEVDGWEGTPVELEEDEWVLARFRS